MFCLTVGLPLLFDSWFATPKGITAIKKELSLNVLAMLKKSGKVFYEYQDKQLDLKKIYAINRKRQADRIQNPRSYRLRPKQSKAQGLDCFDLHGHGHF